MVRGQLKAHIRLIRTIRVLALAGLMISSSTAKVSAALKIDPLLSQILNFGGPFEPVEAIVTFSTRPGALDLAALSSTGVQILPFRHLPMVAIKGTRLQVSALTALSLPKLVSIYWNRPLTYFLDESTQVIGATPAAQM